MKCSLWNADCETYESGILKTFFITWKYIEVNKMNRTIMIVDSEQSFHELYASMLEGTGYEIIHAYDGEEALSMLERKKPDLIITEIVFDMMTGDTFFLLVKSMSTHENIPFIIVSSISLKSYKSLKDVDPNLVLLDKRSMAKEKLIKEIKAKIGEKDFNDTTEPTDTLCRQAVFKLSLITKKVSSNCIQALVSVLV